MPTYLHTYLQTNIHKLKISQTLHTTQTDIQTDAYKQTPTYIQTYIPTSYKHTTPHPYNPTLQTTTDISDRNTDWCLQINAYIHTNLHSYKHTTPHPYTPTLQFLPYPTTPTLPYTYILPTHERWKSKIEHEYIREWKEGRNVFPPKKLATLGCCQSNKAYTNKL